MKKRLPTLTASILGLLIIAGLTAEEKRISHADVARSVMAVYEKMGSYSASFQITSQDGNNARAMSGQCFYKGPGKIRLLPNVGLSITSKIQRIYGWCKWMPITKGDAFDRKHQQPGSLRTLGFLHVSRELGEQLSKFEWFVGIIDPSPNESLIVHICEGLDGCGVHTEIEIIVALESCTGYVL
jgi:hypothetical protein